MTAVRFLVSFLILTFAAVSVSAQDSYRIRSGDTLTVEVLEDASLNRSVVVLPDGRFSFPFAGEIQARGRTVGDVQSAVISGIASNFAAPPTVFVSVIPAERVASSGGSGPRTIDVYFLGAVNTPGIVPVKRGTTLLQAIAQSGGFGDFAATKRIQLRRTDKKTGSQSVFKINYKALADGAAMENNIRLQDGDVILVPERRLFE